GIFAFIWRLSLTTGTGSIFGFLVARQAYNSAIMAPMFIVMSFSFGLAFYILVLFAGMSWTGRPLGDAVVKKLKNLLGVFCAVVLYFVLVQHLTNLYVTERHGVEAFILRDGGIYTTLFWVVQVFLGGLVPMALVFHPTTGKSRQFISLASILVILGGMAQVYVIIIGGQAYPLDLFPGMNVSSSFFDGVINPYTPSLAEIVLGLGGVAITLGIVVVALKFLPILPANLADAMVDPHYQPPAEPEPETAGDEVGAEKAMPAHAHAPGH
ncbi:MAG TPA: molybdopterin oxidoreductase, partial [Alphaproteobacteria bacterium]|nr:molybdopterin oxidoreductase [Alphaproteobacteria bacterium]